MFSDISDNFQKVERYCEFINISSEKYSKTLFLYSLNRDLD